MFAPLQHAIKAVLDDRENGPVGDSLYLLSAEHLSRLEREYNNFFEEPIDK